MTVRGTTVMAVTARGVAATVADTPLSLPAWSTAVTRYE
jgi:hypothetical protein